jgi:hypothetical protein
MKRKLLLLLFIFSGNLLLAQSKVHSPIVNNSNNWSVQAKNYYLLTQFERNTLVRKKLSTDPVLIALLKTKTANIRSTLTNCNDINCFIESLKFSDAEIKTVSGRLQNLYQPNNALGKLVKNELLPSYAYSLYEKLSPKEILVKAWEQDAMSINHTLSVYAEGQKANYQAIDSISFKVHDKSYNELVYNTTAALLGDTANNQLFFELPMQAALLYLDLNDRNNAATYEPMATTVNKAAVAKAKTIKWANYKYTLIMVPGLGPEEKEVAIDPAGKLRCRLAATAYLKGEAPFIMVSGGKVHPYKTKYCEAEEMKRYLIHELNIPESAVLMEPHARHTTTNMRNAVRLIYKYHLPANKAAVVVTDRSQSAYISGMAERCMSELKYIPYKLGVRLSDTEQAFYPVKKAMQINPLEPLDP